MSFTHRQVRLPLGLTVDPAEVIRFVVSGIVGTAANLAVVWLVRPATGYPMAVLSGLGAGFLVSFVLSKLFAFRSRALAHTPGELARFMLVYAAGTCCALAVSLVLGRGVLPLLMLPLRRAELLGALCGASTMAVTSYFGHRFWTYRHLLG